MAVITRTLVRFQGVAIVAYDYDTVLDALVSLRAVMPLQVTAILATLTHPVAGTVQRTLTATNGAWTPVAPISLTGVQWSLICDYTGRF